MTVTFDQDSVNHFEFTNGRKPKGNGHWSFQLHRDDGSSTEWKSWGNFAVLKKFAMREARALGCTVVTVNT
jgi:hypothetical protein